MPFSEEEKIWIEENLNDGNIVECEIKFPDDPSRNFFCILEITETPEKTNDQPNPESSTQEEVTK